MQKEEKQRGEGCGAGAYLMIISSEHMLTRPDQSRSDQLRADEHMAHSHTHFSLRTMMAG